CDNFSIVMDIEALVINFSLFMNSIALDSLMNTTSHIMHLRPLTLILKSLAGKQLRRTALEGYHLYFPYFVLIQSWLEKILFKHRQNIPNTIDVIHNVTLGPKYKSPRETINIFMPLVVLSFFCG
ncbi:hypothetical protein ACJX0J_010115, partial [Zea mays]